MHFNLACAVGMALTLFGWLICRLEAGARSYSLAPIVLDIVVPITIYVLVTVISARPIFAGEISCALSIGLAIADYCKRRAFGEPVLVSDFILSIDILRHPKLCLIFPRPFLLVSIVVLAVLIIACEYVFEEPTLQLPLWSRGASLAVLVFALWTVANPLQGIVAARLKRFELTGRPLRDARLVGSFAMLITYAILARAQRETLQSAASRRPLPMGALSNAAVSPIIVVQCESFFDVRRLHESVSTSLLPTYDRCRQQAHQWGRLSVPARGANTVRTEFAVMTGLPAKAAGFDQFNPYHRFAQAPILSLAWRLRSEGYRTICIHPFDRTFYGRDKVLKHLGFDEFLGEEAFPGVERRNSYVCDIEVARLITKKLKENGSKTFVFAITMENHGPWSKALDASQCDASADFPPVRDAATLRSYLEGVASADTMLKHLVESLGAHANGGLLAFYGDHLPNLPQIFRDLGFRERRSDYLLWRTDGGTGLRKDLAAHQLTEEIWRAHHAPATVT